MYRTMPAASRRAVGAEQKQLWQIDKLAHCLNIVDHVNPPFSTHTLPSAHQVGEWTSDRIARLRQDSGPYIDTVTPQSQAPCTKPRRHCRSLT